RDPGRAEALHFIGYMAYLAGGLDDALALIGRAIEAETEIAAYRNDRGLVLWALGRPMDAAGELRRGLALRPGFAEAWLNLGNAARNLEHLDAALGFYRRTLALDARRVEA